MSETDSFGPRHVAELHLIAYLDRRGVLSLRATNELGDVVTARGGRVPFVARRMVDMALENASIAADSPQGPGSTVPVTGEPIEEPTFTADQFRELATALRLGSRPWQHRACHGRPHDPQATTTQGAEDWRAEPAQGLDNPETCSTPKNAECQSAVPVSPPDQMFSRYMGGQKCDMWSGPCSCGAWHGTGSFEMLFPFPKMTACGEGVSWERDGKIVEVYVANGVDAPQLFVGYAENARVVKPSQENLRAALLWLIGTAETPVFEG